MFKFFNKLKKTPQDFFKLHYQFQANELNKLCKKYGCDKGSFEGSEKFFSWKPHSYTDLYYFLFSTQRFHIKKVFELGIGTNKVFNEKLKRKSLPGASLRVWKNFFCKAKIFGADIDPNTLFEEDRIKTFKVDQFDSQSINEMWKKVKIRDFDLIIDDGCHQFDGTINFFLNSINFLGPNGFYIIEDIFYKDKQRFMKYFEKKKFNYFFVELSSRNNLKDNNLFVIKK